MMTDALIAALIDKLPAIGKPFPAEQRAAWLKMMAMAFDVAYGAGDELPDFLGTFGGKAGGGMRDAASAAPAPPKPQPPGPRFIIDRQGYARNGDGEPVLPGDVTDIIVDQRGETGDLGAIVWADGSMGVAGVQLDIQAML